MPSQAPLVPAGSNSLDTPVLLPSRIAARLVMITARGRRRPSSAVIRKWVGPLEARCREFAATMRREKLKLPLTAAGRQRQTQFASSSSNGCDVTSNLSRHRRHPFLPLREFDQQLGLFFGPFAGFCRLHCCFCSTDRNRHQSKRRRSARSSDCGKSAPLMLRLICNVTLPHDVISPHKQGSFDFSRTRVAFFRDLPD